MGSARRIPLRLSHITHIRIIDARSLGGRDSSLLHRRRRLPAGRRAAEVSPPRKRWEINVATRVPFALFHPRKTP